ncbi:hypothetical protein DFH08DRAFT_102360 [Mycena albidolilacea]|uniref:Uncharacterized protein n=1 Tax=Mycena albidolilacea TaxID=1033008 RepID=A0AAD6YY25_9AGAR|nr:hypothetical protein DFH08DRAFT_102360 [Mycena albidolilacea]
MGHVENYIGGETILRDRAASGPSSDVIFRILTSFFFALLWRCDTAGVVHTHHWCLVTISSRWHRSLILDRGLSCRSGSYLHTASVRIRLHHRLGTPRGFRHLGFPPLLSSPACCYSLSFSVSTQPPSPRTRPANLRNPPPRRENPHSPQTALNAA